MGVSSGGMGAVHGLWIFIHGTNIVDRGLKVLFFGVFCYFSVATSPGRGLIVLFFGLFSVAPPLPPGNFSAGAIGLHASVCNSTTLSYYY